MTGWNPASRERFGDLITYVHLHVTICTNILCLQKKHVGFGQRMKPKTDFSASAKITTQYLKHDFWITLNEIKRKMILTNNIEDPAMHVN